MADTGHGYAAEFRIPLATLRFAAAPVQSWGFQVRRFIDARQEYDDWAFYPRSAVSYVPLFGTLDNLVGLRPRHRLELRPFLLGKVGHRTVDAAVLASGGYADASAGLDAKAHVTNELTLDLTMNPDFGQVEADAAVLNLSTYEVVYPEKRPFFLEGYDTFAAIRPLVYTRRIGRRSPTPGLAGETLVENPDPVTIWGAAKLTGTLRGRTTLGLISAVTGAQPRAVRSRGRAAALPPGRPLDHLQRPAGQASRRAQHRHRRAGDGGQPVRDAPPRRRDLPGLGPPRRPRRPLPERRLRGQHRRALALAQRQLRHLLAGGRHHAAPRPAPAGARRHPDRPRHPLGQRRAARRQGRRRPLGLERLAVPVGAPAGVQRRRLPGTEERLPGLRVARLPDADADPPHRRFAHAAGGEPAPRARRAGALERGEAERVGDVPELLGGLRRPAPARRLLRRPRAGTRATARRCNAPPPPASTRRRSPIRAGACSCFSAATSTGARAAGTSTAPSASPGGCAPSSSWS